MVYQISVLAWLRAQLTHVSTSVTLSPVQVSTKLALALTLTSTVILGAYGVRELRQQERDLRGAAEHDFRLLGTAVQVGVENSVRDRQVADVHEILEALELSDAAVDVLVFDAAGVLQANSLGSEASVELVRPELHSAGAGRGPDIRYERLAGVENLVGIFPLRDDRGLGLGSVAVVWPLDELRRQLRATAVTAVVSSLTLIAGITAVGWILSLLLVRRPLQALTQAMRSVEAGNWVARVNFSGGDEVGAAVAQFNAMVHELGEARRHLVEAAEAREALEAGLQRLDKLATVGQLSAGLAHEIGSPLQILNGRARAIAARTDVPPDVLRSAQIVAAQSDRIAGIVERLLGFARRKAPHIAAVDLRATVGAIIELLSPEARRRSVQLVFDGPERLPRVLADADQVQQVTMNLLSNALRAATGQGLVRVSLQPSSFQPTDAAPPVASVSLVVDDDGEGIPEPVRQRIFEPFFTTWSSSGGTGLGLAVIKSIVDEHGGTIDVTSAPGAGTRVTVHFPLAGPQRVVA